MVPKAMNEKQDKAAWCLEGAIDGSGKTLRAVVRPLPFRIGRRPDFDLMLASKRVSQTHAELFAAEGSDALWIRDLGSTNGTFVNGERIHAAHPLNEGDIIHLAELELRLVKAPALEEQSMVSKTMAIRSSDLPLSLLDQARQFRIMLRDDLFSVVFQPLVRFSDLEIVGYEVLGRGRLGDRAVPTVELFHLACELGMEEKLSSAFRDKGLEQARSLPGQPIIFFNTHPAELNHPEPLLAALRNFRAQCPDLQLALEIHEAAVTDLSALRGLCGQLEELRIGVAFDDFGTGQARLVELSHVAPQFLKFDAVWIRDLDRAIPRRREMVLTLVQMVLNMGIAPIAEGVETAAEAEACRELGFQYGQGYFFSRPAPLEQFLKKSP